MIISRLKGGLGNQMFQYALGRVLSLKNNVPLGLDISFYDTNLIPKRQYDLDVFNIPAYILDKKEISLKYKIFRNKFLNKIFKNKGKESSFSFDPQIFSLKGDIYLDGYWQSPKYFIGYEDIIRKDLTFKNSLTQNIKNFAEEIKKTNSLCVHIRRGDYVGNKFHEVVDNEYYKKGVSYILDKISIDKIFVFSDDISWCRDNLSFNVSTVFVDESYTGIKGEGHLFLMSQCRYFVIANSSFSWWGAWLSDYKEKIVVCPKQWFNNTKINTNDLIPENWIRI